MLVISRKVGESLIISDNIKVTIMAAVGDKISIGVEAPREISIVREELLDTIEANKSSTSHGSEAAYKNLAAFMKTNKKS